MLGKRSRLLYIQIQPPSIRNKFHSFYITKNWLLVYCLCGLFLFQLFACYSLGTSYFKYRFINEKYQKMRKMQKNMAEYQIENGYYLRQLRDIRQKAYTFYNFSEKFVLNQELRPFLNVLATVKGTHKEENIEELNSFVSHLHNQMKEMSLFYNNKEYRMLFFTPSITPISDDYMITSRYGFRKSPFNGKQEFHRGIDFCCRLGTDIHATAYGEVIFAREGCALARIHGERFGEVVIVNHGDSGFLTYYAHCSKIFVKEGDWVERGQVIAAVGSSGASTGPHLHYEIRRYNRPRNPIYYLPNVGRSVEKFANLSKKLME